MFDNLTLTQYLETLQLFIFLRQYQTNQLQASILEIFQKYKTSKNIQFRNCLV